MTEHSEKTENRKRRDLIFLLAGLLLGLAIAAVLILILPKKQADPPAQETTGTAPEQSATAAPMTAASETPAPVRRPLAELRENYTPEQAERDDCVVLDGNDLLHGQLLWNEFLQQTRAGEPAVIRVYQGWRTPENDYTLFELEYTGAEYALSFYDRTGDTHEWFLSTGRYRYLKEETFTLYENTDLVYMLTDDMTAEYEEYIARMVSSIPLSPDPRYDNIAVLFRQNNSVPPGQYTSVYGIETYDVDGDGTEERCYLCRGRTSGLFTFFLYIYGRKDGLRYTRTYCTDFMELSFARAEDGKLCVQGVTGQGDPAQTHLYRIVTRDGEIELEENGECLKGDLP
nr:hypothetical protein [Lachnospiraceae bacterium]